MPRVRVETRRGRHRRFCPRVALPRGRIRRRVPPRDVYQVRRLLHLVQGVGVDHPLGLFDQRCVQGDGIRFLEEVVELPIRCTCPFYFFLGQIRVRSDDVKSERSDLFGDELGDRSKADEAERLSLEPVDPTLFNGWIPRTALQGSMVISEIPLKRQHEHHGVFGHFVLAVHRDRSLRTSLSLGHVRDRVYRHRCRSV